MSVKTLYRVSLQNENVLLMADKDVRLTGASWGVQKNKASGDKPTRWRIVTYTLKRINGKVAGAGPIRQLVTVVAQSPDLPPRAPFELIQPMIRGITSDVQVFEYE